MKKVIVIMALVLITTLACSFTSRVPGTQPSPTNGNQSTQTIPLNIQDVTTWQSRWDWSISNPIHYSFAVWDFPLYFLTENINDPTNNTIILNQQFYFVDNGAVYFSNENQQPTKIELESGNMVWQSDLQGNILGLGNTTVLVYRDDNRIYGLGKSNGEEIWKIIINTLIPEGQRIKPFPYSLLSQSDIIVPMEADCSMEREIRFLHINDTSGEASLTECGSSYWLDTPYAISNSIIVAEDLHAMGSGCFGAFDIAGINPQDGSVIWNVNEDDYGCYKILETNAVNNRMYIETGYKYSAPTPNQPEFIAIDTRDGTKIWGEGLFAKNNLLNSGQITGNALIENFFLTKDYIFYTSSEEIFVFQKDNGLLVNRIPQDRSYKFFISENNGLIISYPDLGIIKGIDPISSQGLWENDELSLDYSLLTVGDVILFEEYQTQEVFAINQKTGELLWKKFLDGWIYSSDDNGPLSYLSFFTRYGDEIIYKDAQDSRIILLNPLSGDTRVIIDIPLGARTIQQLEENLWLVQFTGQLSLINLK